MSDDRPAVPESPIAERLAIKAEQEEADKAAREARYLVSDDGDVLCSVLYANLLVRRDEEEKRTAGGIEVPEVARKKLLEGDVLATGGSRLLRDGREIPLKVGVGDHVVFGNFAGAELPDIFGERLVILREDEVLAVRKRKSNGH